MSIHVWAAVAQLCLDCGTEHVKCHLAQASLGKSFPRVVNILVNASQQTSSDKVWAERGGRKMHCMS